jgi:hypothetical protein
MLSFLRDIRPLAETGAVLLYPWEKVLLKNKELLRDASLEIITSGIPDAVGQKYLQIEYTMGVRIGSIGIEASKTQKMGSPLAPGTRMWLRDKGAIAVYSIINALYSKETNGALVNDKRGDRVVYDFIATGGTIEPRREFGAPIKLPRFSSAAWNEIVEIRKNATALEELRNIINEASNCNEERVIGDIQERLQEKARTIRGDHGIRHVVRQGTIDLSLGAVIGASVAFLNGSPLLAASIGAGALTAGAIGGGKGAVATLIKQFLKKDRRDAAKGAELLCRVADTIDNEH